MNEIDINDEIKKMTVSFGEALCESIKPLLDELDGLEPYQMYELLHPRKKPRGSIRRNRKKRKYTAKDGYEIGKALYNGMMEGFEQGGSDESQVSEERE